MKIDPNDITYPKVTGGYITKSDKTTGGILYEKSLRIND